MASLWNQIPYVCGDSRYGIPEYYSSIRHQNGIEVVRFFLGMSNWDSNICDLILDLLHFILTHKLCLRLCLRSMLC